MTLPQSLPILNFQGSHRLLLTEVLEEARCQLPEEQIVIRASENRKLKKILQYGTDRGGYKSAKPWRFNRQAGTNLTHAEVIFATTIEENIKALDDPVASCTVKKIDILDEPLILVYDKDFLERVWDRQFAFRKGRAALSALKAVYVVNKVSPIPGWFREDDGLFYRQLAGQISCGSIVEIGSWKGLSTSYLVDTCRRNKNTVICVDWWKRGSLDEYSEHYHEMSQKEDVECVFDKNMNALGFRPKKYSCSSAEAASQFSSGEVDMVFLDGSHDLASVKHDIDFWYQKIKHNGILAGHDYKEKHTGVRLAVDSFTHTHGLSLQMGGASIWWVRVP